MQVKTHTDYADTQIFADDLDERGFIGIGGDWLTDFTDYTEAIRMATYPHSQGDTCFNLWNPPGSKATKSVKSVKSAYLWNPWNPWNL